MSTQTPLINPIPLRAQFPALNLEINGKTAVYLDGPGGTQVPQRVIDAISEALTLCQITPVNVPVIYTHYDPPIYTQDVPPVYSACSTYSNTSSAN